MKHSKLIVPKSPAWLKVTLAIAVALSFVGGFLPSAKAAFTIPDTGQDKCYSDSREIPCPSTGNFFYGQDAQYKSPQPAYKDNRDGTITDLVTGLTWQKEYEEKMTWDKAKATASQVRTGGYSDWRLPTIKELYSLIDFKGYTGRSASESTPYISTRYFKFKFGDTSSERMIDAQYWSATEYVGTTMQNSPTTFGVNFADGRIKGYGRVHRGNRQMTQYVRYVRGTMDYGINQFVDNGDGTVTDEATGLMWMQVDSGFLNAGKGGALNWKDALSWAENLTYAGKSDWRLPNAKELQSIVDYTRSPSVTGTPAIDPIFKATMIYDQAGKINYGYYWTGTTHLEGPRPGGQAVYVAFGQAQGFMGAKHPMDSNKKLQDVHGAGAQRSDPKSGDPSRFPQGRGPQGDDIRIYNMVRCVRNVN